MRLSASAFFRTFFLIFFLCIETEAFTNVLPAIENAIEKEVFQSHNRIVPLHQKIEIAAAMEFSGAL